MADSIRKECPWQGVMQHAIIIAVVGLCTGLLLLYGAHAYPLPTGDSVYFIPPTLSVANGDGMVQTLIAKDTQGANAVGKRMLWYPPLFFIVVGGLIWEPTYMAVSLVVALFSSLSLLIATWLLYTTTTLHGQSLTWYRTLLIILSIVGLCSALLYQQSRGRTESLVTCWLLLGALGAASTPPRSQWLPLGVGLGLMSATHFAGAMVATLLISAYFAVIYAFWPALRSILATVLLAGSIFLIIMINSPNGVSETFATTTRAAVDHALFRSTPGSLYEAWIFHTQIPFYGLVFLASLGSLVFLGIRSMQSIKSKWLLTASVALLTFCVYQLSIPYPTRSYNIVLFAPLSFLVLIWLLTHHLPLVTLRQRTVHLGLTIILALSTIGFARASVLYPVYLQQGMSLVEARRLWHTQDPGAPCSIGVSLALWGIVDPNDYWRVYPIHPDLVRMYAQPRFRGSPEVLLIQQSHTGQTHPPDIAGYTLVSHTYIPHPFSIFGVRIANTVPGYAYALYSRTSAEQCRPAEKSISE